MTLASEHRKRIPVGVQVKSALLAAGFSEEEIETPGAIEWDHGPALSLRVFDEATGELVPPANDWRFIRPVRKAEHLQKTTGRRPGAQRTATTAGSDIGNAAKVKRLERARLERETRVAQVGPETCAACGLGDEEIDRAARVDRGGDDMKRIPQNRWPKGRKIQSRGFERRRKAK